MAEVVRAVKHAAAVTLTDLTTEGRQQSTHFLPSVLAKCVKMLSRMTGAHSKELVQQVCRVRGAGSEEQGSEEQGQGSEEQGQG